MFHLCPDEIFAFMLALPIIRKAYLWAKDLIINRKKKESP
jgi:hypothetical protein